MVCRWATPLSIAKFVGSLEGCSEGRCERTAAYLEDLDEGEIDGSASPKG